MAYGRSENQALRALTERVAPSVVSVVAYDAEYRTLLEGAGFFCAEGRVATSRHILQGAHAARVMLVNGAVLDVLGVLGDDAAADLAVLAVDIPDGVAKPLVLSKEIPREGERVAVLVGRPAPSREGLEGVVNSVKTLPFLGRVLTVTCPPFPGSSGSPVFAMDGEVVGLAVARGVDGGTIQYVVPSLRLDDLSTDRFVKISDRPRTETDEDPARFLPGVRHLFHDGYEEALRSFRAVADQDPRDGAAWKACSACLAALGRGRDAVEAAQAAVNIDPEDPDAWAAMGVACVEAQLFAEAVDACRKVSRARPADPGAWNRLGVACYDAGLPEEAVNACRESIRLLPDDPRVHKNLGVALLALGRLPDAVDAFREAVRLRPDFDRAWKDMAICYFKLGSYEKAVDAGLEAVRVQPSFYNAHNNLGACYQALGQTESAVKSYKEALRLRPRFARAWSNLAYAYLRLERSEDAVKAYEEAVARAPGDVEARTSLAVLYRNAGRTEDARKALTEALRADPKHGAAHYHLGRLYLEQGNKGAALEEYKVLKDLDPQRANLLFDLVYK